MGDAPFLSHVLGDRSRLCHYDRLPACFGLTATATEDRAYFFGQAIEFAELVEPGEDGGTGADGFLSGFGAAVFLRTADFFAAALRLQKAEYLFELGGFLADGNFEAFGRLERLGLRAMVEPVGFELGGDVDTGQG